MNYVITEIQLRSILKEINDSKLSSSMKILYSFTKNIVNKSITRYDINLRFLLKFGTSIGGLVAPLDNYIKNSNLSLSDDQIALVLVGIASTYFFENKSKLGEILDKINEEGLMDVFKQVLEKADNLRISFFNFLKSLPTTIETATEMISYSFLIPIITDIFNLISDSNNISESSSLITERLLSSGVVVVSGIALAELVKKIAERFSNR